MVDWNPLECLEKWADRKNLIFFELLLEDIHNFMVEEVMFGLDFVSETAGGLMVPPVQNDTVSDLATFIVFVRVGVVEMLV